MILVGPTLGRINTGIAVFEAPDEEAARRDHGGGSGHRQRHRHGRAAPVLVALLRGRDDV